MLTLEALAPVTSVTPSAPPASLVRVAVRGKFLFAGDEKLYIRGVTYGPFHPDADGCLYRDLECVRRDFTLMRANDINAIRTYTVPPLWLLDAAQTAGIRVMVGLPWEQHVTVLDTPGAADDIERRVREGVRSCRNHPAILCFTIGNEIPASVVRWHGRTRTEAFLRRLYAAVKAEDSSALVTYVNFPPTEYLQLDFVDFVSFNVYLEKQDRLEAYLARLQNLAGNKPVVMAEIGLDSRRNGETQQAMVLGWQVRSVFGAGCAGLFVFAWTDEWSRGGFEIEDWDFGLTSRTREPKRALETVSAAFARGPFPRDYDWPWISVVICTFNGARTIRETLSTALGMTYPAFEILVVNDGSSDDTPDIVASFPQVRLLTVPNGGLSAARNIGLRAAEGEIIAYLDDDAFPDPHWLHYLALAFARSNHVAIGGPNIPPPGDGSIAECVANAPGGPIHVLLTDHVAEHIPGCNFAVRKAALERIGGFDPAFRVAGDDVDACWRLRESGGTLGFAPAAVVWHHRRNSITAYWRQQKGYGKAEALLERKWPLKYNAAGHVGWAGRLYGTGVLRSIGRPWRVYQGTWGSALFQSIYEPSPGRIQSFAQMPEWYILVMALLILSGLGVAWAPLFGFAPLAVAALAVPLSQAVAAASRAYFPSQPSGFAKARLVCLTAALFLVQPAARLWGRVSHGLTPFRRRQPVRRAIPAVRVEAIWTERWQLPEHWLQSLETVALEATCVVRGGDYDSWDLDIRGGVGGSARVQLGIEEHGAGRQLLRWRISPRFSPVLMLTAVTFAGLSLAAWFSRAPVASVLLAVAGLVPALWTSNDASTGVGVALAALDRLRKRL